MKKIIKNIFIVLLGAMMFTSCKKFLSITPKTQLPEDEFFSTESGFKDALTGVYIQLESSSAYGQAMTMTTIEDLVSSWTTDAQSVEQKLENFNYSDEDVQNRLAAIFKQEYSIIAATNAILEQIDERKSVFRTDGMYETIKSECLAIRAYCHFDLLRLFGPIPTDPGNGNMLAYVTTISRTPNAHIPFSEYKTDLLKDLTDAAALVKDIDPITKYSLDDLKLLSKTGPYQPSDSYLAYRYLRMNYYAIKALEARAYLWFDDKTNAYSSAKEVIDAKDENGNPEFRLGTAADFSAGNYTLTNEQIFGLYFTDDIYSGLYENGTLQKGSSPTLIKTNLFGNTGVDIREVNLWTLVTQSNQAKDYVIKKYDVEAEPSSLSTDYNQIPMLRLSEMYLIAIETGPTADAQTLWDTYRTSRNLAAEPLRADPVQLQDELLKEYRKEFYAEGQAFFAYKRVNAPASSIIFAPPGITANYLIPLPRVETTQ